MSEPTPLATLAMVNLDAPDPGALADFYSAILGWPVVHRQAEYAMISPEAGAPIGFGRVEGHVPPEWSEDAAPDKRFHLDLSVDDPDEAAARCVALGATKPTFQPGADRWTVLQDPAGHPFCLCRRP
ncbi:VOC family protein [Cryptosporangium phraense]|uniref:VOC family protein n=1 Tax=Cryptosporangium phraense TaxID=2593070 RepID=A0A545AZH2_9ACTN|nr:VOC family protein [Cryptosporangium phraense]TQS46709.1 VOC family protein [Cryptosporangium phraense]